MKPSQLVNKKAWNFILDSNKGEISLKDFKGKNVILYFYPKDSTPGCTIEARDFSSLHNEFKKQNCEIIGISKDSLQSHDKFIKNNKLKIILASDPDHKVQEKYGVWQKKKFMGREYMGTSRTTFLINEKGYVKRVWENVKVKGHAKEVLKALEGLS